MKTPLDLIKTYLTFKSYFTWFLMASAIFGIVLFFKRKVSTNQTTYNNHTWKGYLTYFLIIIGILSFIYLCFFHKPKEPSSKYAGQLAQEIDKAIDKYNEVINNYQGLKDNWEQELTKVEVELKKLYEEQKITQEQKEKIKELINQTETKINEIKTQKQETENNINVLKEQLKQKEEALANKEKEIKLTEKQIVESTDLTEKEKLNIKFEQLHQEVQTLIGQISHIKSEIEGFESKYRMYTEQLEGAEGLKNDLKKRFNELKTDEKSYFNLIQSVEQRRNEIQNNINEIKEKQSSTKAERKSLEIMKQAAWAAKSAADDYERKNRLNISSVESFIGNVIGEVLQFKKIVYVWEEGKNLVNQLRGAETKEQIQERKQKEYDDLLAKQLGIARMLFQNPDGTMKMIDQSTFDSINHDLEKQISKLNADHKDYQKKLEEYNNRMKQENIQQELNKNEELNKNIQNEFQSWINEYTKITDELIQNRKQIQDINKLEDKKFALEEQLQPRMEERNAILEELKLQNPNYAKVQERIKQKRYNKFLKPITN